MPASKVGVRDGSWRLAAPPLPQGSRPYRTSPLSPAIFPSWRPCDPESISMRPFYGCIGRAKARSEGGGHCDPVADICPNPLRSRVISLSASSSRPASIDQGPAGRGR